MATAQLTNITPPRVPFLGPKTGLVSREWYRFFLSLFVLTWTHGWDQVVIWDTWLKRHINV